MSIRRRSRADRAGVGQQVAGACLAMAMVLGLVACGGGGGGAPASTAANEQIIYVDAGPSGTGYNANRLYTDVTVCQPGSATNCQTIDHVLLDTGSTGLRLLNSVLSSALGLTKAPYSATQTLVNCARFVDGSFGWGPVATADIRLGSQTAAGARVQLIGDPAFTATASACSTGSAITTVSDIGAKGILGVGLFKEDCGSACAGVALAKYYYACPAAGACVSVAVANANQVKNPVALLASDNNGVVIDLPAVGLQPASGVAGRMYLGVATQSNNQLGIAKVFKTDAQGYVTTTLGGKVMAQSFFDTGSNGVYFDNSAATGVPALVACGGSSGAIGFYCPVSALSLLTTVTSSTGSTSITFYVDNATNSFAGAPPVLPGLAGTLGSAQGFDWGLPFFYGRRVFFGIEGMVSLAGTGPYYAF